MYFGVGYVGFQRHVQSAFTVSAGVDVNVEEVSACLHTDDVHAGKITFYSLAEAVPILAAILCPRRLGNGQRTRKCLIISSVGGRHILIPDVSLQTNDVFFHQRAPAGKVFSPLIQERVNIESIN